MTIEAALTAKIAATAALTALVGARVYPDEGKQGDATDYLVYQFTGRDDAPPVDGSANGLVKDTVELTPYSTDRLVAAAIRDALVAAFNGLAARGTWGGVGGVDVRACTCESAQADHHPPADGSETSDRLSRVVLNVFWKRS